MSVRHPPPRCPACGPCPTYCALPVLLLILGAHSVFAAVGGPELDEVLANEQPAERFVAEVGTGRVGVPQVFEVWEPIWRDTMRQYLTGAQDKQATRARLQQAWEEAVETAIQEEVFYQEAKRQYDQWIRDGAALLFERKTGHKPRPSHPLYREILTNVRLRYAQRLDELVSTIVDLNTRRLGGTSQLQAVLARQGITWTEWRDRIRRRALIRDYHRHNLPLNRLAEPRPADIRAYYRQYRADFEFPGATTFRHIFVAFARHGGEVPARARARALFETLRDAPPQNLAERFAQLARTESDDAPSAPYGGLEPLPEGATTPEGEALASSRLSWMADVHEAIGDLEVGKLGPVLLSTAGCHLVLILTREEGGVVPFAKAQQEITSLLAGKRREAVILRHYNRLREDVRIEVLMPRFPAAYAPEAIAATPKGQRRVQVEAMEGTER